MCRRTCQARRKRRSDKKPPTAAELQDDRALLLLAVREGRDDGRSDRAGLRAPRPQACRARHGRLPQRFRTRHRRACRGVASPDRRVAVVSVLPVKDLDTLAPGGEDLKRARLISSTRSPREQEVVSLLQPIRHVRDYVSHHGDRCRCLRHVGRIDLVDGVGWRVVDQEVVARRLRVTSPGAVRPRRSGPMSAPPPAGPI